MVFRDGAWAYIVPVGRSLAGLIAALLLAFGGDITGRVFNLLSGYPWSQEVHLHIHFVTIGAGAGLGAYLGWIDPNRSWRITAGLWILVIAVGVLGVYLGRAYSPGVDPSYWWSRFATDTTIHFSAAVSGTIVATVIGLIQQAVSVRQANSYWESWVKNNKQP